MLKTTFSVEYSIDCGETSYPAFLNWSISFFVSSPSTRDNLDLVIVAPSRKRQPPSAQLELEGVLLWL